MSTLEIKNLAKSFKGRPVVHDVSLSITSGQVVGLLGPNGAGKTTCFYMIVGLIKADAGSINFNNQYLTHMAMHQRARIGIGYLPQESSVFRKLSVADNISAILELRKDLSRNQQQRQLEHLLEEFHIQHIRSNKGISLSGGERRRVEIARALASEPQFILLDEPFAGVDPISVSEIKLIIKHLALRDIGVLITDHNVRETLDICEKAYIVSDGRIIAAGSSAEVLANQTVRDVYLGHQFSI